LTERFGNVIATDASADQITRAPRHPRVEYRVAPAEQCGLARSSVDLAVAAQAAHWFKLDEYYQEVHRVVRPGGLVALIVYGLQAVGDPIIDRIMKQFYGQTLGGYWPPQRRWVEEEYQTIAFPFPEIPTPRFEMIAEWNLDEILGYVETWSAVGLMVKATGRGAAEDFRAEMTRLWGNPHERRTVRWPLVLRVGRV
jgi:SAM-dependent methyltransferase